MYSKDYRTGDEGDCPCVNGQSAPSGACPYHDNTEMRGNMAAEDYIDECDFDPYLEDDEPPGGWSPYYQRQLASLPSSSWGAPKPRRVSVDLPGSVALSSLQPGETFRFANAVNAVNVYMVIASQDLSAALVHYVLLNTGKVYSSNPTKRVFQVDARITIDSSHAR